MDDVSIDTASNSLPVAVNHPQYTDYKPEVGDSDKVLMEYALHAMNLDAKVDVNGELRPRDNLEEDRIRACRYYKRAISRPTVIASCRLVVAAARHGLHLVYLLPQPWSAQLMRVAFKLQESLFHCIPGDLGMEVLDIGDLP